MRDGRSKSDRIENCSTANYNDVTAPVEVCVIDALEHSLKNVDVVLDNLAARYRLDVSRREEAVGMIVTECIDAFSKIRNGISNRLVEPELNARQLIARRFQYVKQDVLIVVKHVFGKTQTMHKRNRERDIDHPGVVAFLHGDDSLPQGAAGGIRQSVGDRTEVEVGRVMKQTTSSAFNGPNPSDLVA